MATLGETPATKANLESLCHEMQTEMARMEIRLTRWTVGAMAGMTAVGLGGLTLILKYAV